MIAFLIGLGLMVLLALLLAALVVWLVELDR